MDKSGVVAHAAEIPDLPVGFSLGSIDLIKDILFVAEDMVTRDNWRDIPYSHFLLLRYLQIDPVGKLIPDILAFVIHTRQVVLPRNLAADLLYLFTKAFGPGRSTEGLFAF